MGRSGECEDLWAIAEVMGGNDNGVACGNEPNIGMEVPIELVVGLG
jgi:hypothetical protein